ncbi:MAG: smalltalk protein [Bacteroides sp.]|nr:smalltalk protein [Bacteroides sp.]
MATKSSLWDKILKIVIAVASAVLGALGANAMNVAS